MNSVDRDLDRILMLLRNKIREHGFTQLQVQEKLEWGRSYISQLLTKQKSLRVEQVLRILEVIGVEPAAFYGELYRFPHGDVVANLGEEYTPTVPGSAPFNPTLVAEQETPGIEQLRVDLDRSRAQLSGLLRLLEEKQIVSAEELEELGVELPGLRLGSPTH